MARVFIPANQGHDYSRADAYGTIHFVTEEPLPTSNFGHMRDLWRRALVNSSKEDWIVVSSLASHLAIGSAIFARRHGRLNLLVFDGGDYVGRTIVLQEEKGQL